MQLQKKNIPLNERMGKIPLWRMEKPSIWTPVGTNVFGPFWVKTKDNQSTVKTFAILWTDLVSWGVMVDLLYSSDTEGENLLQPMVVPEYTTATKPLFKSHLCKSEK